jgi:hypothetical protein
MRGLSFTKLFLSLCSEGKVFCSKGSQKQPLTNELAVDKDMASLLKLQRRTDLWFVPQERSGDVFTCLIRIRKKAGLCALFFTCVIIAEEAGATGTAVP